MSNAHALDTLLTSKSQSTYTAGDVTSYIFEKDTIDSVAEVWQQLENELDSVGITCKWDWVKTWLDHYGEVVDYWFLVGTRNGEPCGIALVTKELQRTVPVRVAGFHIGTDGEPYSDMVRMINKKILVKNESKKAFFSSMLKALTTHFSWEEITFDSYSPDDAFVITDLFTQTKQKFTVDHYPTLYMDLDKVRENGTDVLSYLPPETRYSIKRNIKAFNYDITTQWAENETEAYAILDELIPFYENTWKKNGKRSVFDSEQFSRFQRAIIAKLLPTKEVILFKVASKQFGMLGCLYLFVDEGTAYGYQLGFNDFANVEFENFNKKRLRVGFVVHTLFMEECLKRGIKAYNYSVGAHEYKREITNAETEVVTISLKRGIKPFIREKFFKLYDKLTEKKKSPLPIRMLRKLFDK